MRTLYVAAGGGGDAVGALLARRALGDTDERPPLVTTCAWERLRIDPVPGPRARADFTGLGLIGGEPCEVLPTSDTDPSGRSVLPRLAETSGARILLHDFEGGAVGLASQLHRLAAALDVDKLVVVDVGGDIVARGPEPELRSPLADSLTLAAALRTGIPTSVVVLGPGADAELPEMQVLRLLRIAGGQQVGETSFEDVCALALVLSWHPTEASALVAAGAQGLRGLVAMRRGQDPVPVTARTAKVWTVSSPSFAAFPLAQSLRESKALPEAEGVMRAASVNEIDIERSVAASKAAQPPRGSLRALIVDMEERGATHITRRRLAENLEPQDLAVTEAIESPLFNGMWSREELIRINASRK